jgi:glycosyltransferase involved in cell wall biosynthesis
LGRKPLRLAFVVPWREKGEWIWTHLPPGEFEAEVISAMPSRRRTPYVGEALELARHRATLDRFDVIFAWEMRCALAVALLRRLTGRRQAYFVPVGPILKGALHSVLPLVRWLLADAAQIICFSSAECDAYAEILRLPRERFVFLPTPWRGDEVECDRDNGYILALGRSARDFGTLLRAVRGTDLPVVLVTDSPATVGDESVPPNVCVRYNTGEAETEDLVAGATMHCIPLRPVGYSAGQTVLLRAMAKAKAVVVTDTPGVRDYVENDETAVLVPPSDEVALRRELCRLWSDSTERHRIGSNAARRVRQEFGFGQFAESLSRMATEMAAGTEREQQC